jgi:hypothetical protein
MTDSPLFMTGATQDEVWPLVRKYHYSKRMPSAVLHCFAWRTEGGLFGDTGEPQAAAIYGQPVNRNWPHDALELQRLVRRDDFDKPLSQFLSWTIRWLRSNTSHPFILSYADTGEGHHGGIYQASGWRFVDTRESRHIGFRDAHGAFIHGRSSNTRHGTRSVARIAEIEPSWTPVFGEPKHLYVFPLRQRLKPLLKRFGWTEKPYPKLATCPVDEPAPAGVSTVQPREVAPIYEATE